MELYQVEFNLQYLYIQYHIYTYYYIYIYKAIHTHDGTGNE